MNFAHLEKYLHGEMAEIVRFYLIGGGILLLILAILIFDKVENVRFKRWYNRYGMLDLQGMPWRTIIPWHRAGSKWYNERCDKPLHYGVKTTESAAVEDKLYRDINKTTKIRGYRYR